MKRQSTLLVITGIVAVCTLGLTLISGAQPAIQTNDRPNDRQAARMARGPQPDERRGGPDGPNNRPQGPIEKGLGLNLAGVELSDDQKTQVQQQMREFQLNTAELRQKLQFAEQDLRREMRNETADQAVIDSLWADIADLKQQFGQARTNHVLALKGILTPEQLATIQENEREAIAVQKLRLEQRELLMASGAPNVQRLQAIEAELAEREVALQRQRAEMLAERFANLTPEEQEQLRNRGGRERNPRQ